MRKLKLEKLLRDAPKGEAQVIKNVPGGFAWVCLPDDQDGKHVLARCPNDTEAALVALSYNAIVGARLVEKARVVLSLINDDDSRLVAWREEVDELEAALKAAEHVEVPPACSA